MRHFLVWLMACAVGMPMIFSQSVFAQTPKDVDGVPVTGEYWALIIGIDKYKHMKNLKTPVDDAKAVRDVLISRYGFKPDHVTLLTKPETETARTPIENALQRLTRKLGGPGPNDSVLIYYAGHGQITEDATQGYWVPWDGKDQEPGTLINNAVIRDNIRAMKAKHVLLVSDSCFAGTLFGDDRAGPAPVYDSFYGGRYELTSRRAFTSGAIEPVSDSGTEGHSIFAYHFLKILTKNKKPYLVLDEFSARIAQDVTYNSPQKPRYDPLQFVGHKGGEFVFLLSGTTPTPTPPPAPITESRSGSSTSSGIFNPAPIEEARARPYDITRELAQEITGEDGAPMVLVPSGEFILGSNEGEKEEKPKRKVHLKAFYIDKFEVTTRLYAKFLEGINGLVRSDVISEVTMEQFRAIPIPSAISTNGPMDR